jgi:hypothetical protein
VRGWFRDPRAGGGGGVNASLEDHAGHAQVLERVRKVGYNAMQFAHVLFPQSPSCSCLLLRLWPCSSLLHLT